MKFVGFNLVGIVSNSRAVLKNVNINNLAKDLRDVDINCGELPHDRALGVFWSVSRDCFSYRIKHCDKPKTRRGMLSTICGIFDPIGLLTPVLVKARTLFQETCQLKLGWDDSLPRDIDIKWTSLLNELPLLEKFEVSRCLIGSLKPVRTELHLFCDGSMTAYAAVAFVRQVDSAGKIHCNLVMSKSRQTPISRSSLTTVPRIELNSAKLAVLLCLTLKKELRIVFDEEFFWSDSQTVLQYIRNDTARYHRFVANRVAFIRANSKKDSWKYVPGDKNIADCVSRGMTVTSFLENHEWISGPLFLHTAKSVFIEPSICYPKLEIISHLNVVNVSNVRDCEWFVQNVFNSCSDWNRIKTRMAVFLATKIGLKSGMWPSFPFTADILAQAENKVWLLIQKMSYEEQVNLLSGGGKLRHSDPLYKLSPFIDEDGLMKVGGRLGYCEEPYGKKYPIILPGKSITVQVMVRYIHSKYGHFGGAYLLSIVQESYFVIGLSKLVKSIVRSCLYCRKVNSRPINPVMSDLPVERISPVSRPFTYTGIDYFGPFLVSVGRGRAQAKRYGVVFSCLTSRSIHLEVAESLDIDAFINCFRRFVARRGHPHTVYSDNGTNLVGGCREMKESLN